MGRLMNIKTESALNAWVRTLLLYLGLTSSGYIFHEKIMSDIDEKVSKSFSASSGVELTNRVDRMEGRIETYFKNIDEKLILFINNFSSNKKGQDGLPNS